MAIFKGAGVAIVTPFTEDDQVNYEQLGQMIDYQIENGTDAIIICGTTGESSTLTHEEHDECISFAVRHTAGRVPVIAGTGSNSTAEAIRLSTHAEKAGADGLLLVTPYYNKATQSGLIAHYTAIARSVNIPIILYNVPSRTGCNILPETAVQLAKSEPNIVGIKEASGNISQVAKLAHLAEGCIDIYSGNDDQILPILSLGGIGVISVLSNVAPGMTHDLVASYLAGDVETSRKLQLDCMDLCGALFCEVNPIPVKAALEMVGWKNASALRLPLSPMAPANADKLRDELAKMGLLS
ncbi:4-hydroxy-tetrahydrodipicolinate synthase [Cuneatibacter caecimuris]|uniref:4-hydroxy-tetrahydrodipicolinate synthase n=1 Tax=Cuneatibacter caecimuris TaxID=1796618 RepID=A0A4V2F5G7_9FIRM|nr:4-hydroxy-tetrahydrodipicolinate synthase [Cuneatibacter caecimuris]RZS92759.1 4-hydroxy-tetrahydrodipicolinate synthase [Cuneatibacter caecimuris]